MKTMAWQLDQAAFNAKAIEQFPEDAFNLEQAYEIQRQTVAHRVERGYPLCGVKLGFTSRAKMVQMGVNDLIWGWLTTDMLFEEGSTVDLSQFVHPRVEPEICFLTKRDITGPINALEAVNYIEAVAPALEIIDSRYQNFKFDLNNVVADNCSSAGVIVGSWSKASTDLDNLYVGLSIDGRVVQAGSSSAILGHPMRSFVQAARLLAQSETVLPAGSLIMAGAASAAEALAPDTYVEVMINQLGKAGFHTTRGES